MTVLGLITSPSFIIGAFCGLGGFLLLQFALGMMLVDRGGVQSVSDTTFAKLFGYDDDQRVAMLCPWGGPAGAWQIRVYANDIETGFVRYGAINFDATPEGIANARKAFVAFKEADAFAVEVREAYFIGNYPRMQERIAATKVLSMFEDNLAAGGVTRKH